MIKDLLKSFDFWALFAFNCFIIVATAFAAYVLFFVVLFVSLWVLGSYNGDSNALLLPILFVPFAMAFALALSLIVTPFSLYADYKRSKDSKRISVIAGVLSNVLFVVWVFLTCSYFSQCYI